MSTMTMFLAGAALFVGGVLVGYFIGYVIGHEDGVDDGIREAASPKERRWAI